jgi:hypothetical protein
MSVLEICVYFPPGEWERIDPAERRKAYGEEIVASA